MSADLEAAVRVAGTIALGLLVAIVLFLWRTGGAYDEQILGPGKAPSVKKAAKKQQQAAAAAARDSSSSGLGKKAQPKRAKHHKAPSPSHPWLVNALKGHTGRVTAVEFSQDGKVVATASDDRTIRLWPVKSLGAGGSGATRCVQCNVELDHATHLSFSPDGKACAAAMAQEHHVRLYRVDTHAKSGAAALMLRARCPAEGGMAFEVVGCGLSAHNPVTRTGCTYVMAATAGTELRYFGLDGTSLQDLDTKMIAHNHACLSPNGRLTAVCGRLGMVRLLEVSGKGGVFGRAETVADLMGHKGEAEHASFSPCSRRLAAVSSGGSWQVWDVDVEFDKRADAKRLAGGEFEHPVAGTRAFCALSPHLDVVAVGFGARVTLHGVADSAALATIADAHAGGAVSGIGFDAEGRFMCSAGGMDRRVHVWYNVPGARLSLKSYGAALRGGAGAERAQACIDAIRRDLAEHGIEAEGAADS